MRHSLLLAAVLCLVGCLEEPASTPYPVAPETTSGGLPEEAPPEAEAAEDPEAAAAEPVEEAGQEDLSPAETRLLAVSAYREKLAEQLQAVANSINDFVHIGTAVNEIGVPEARCFAMGTMLGMDDVVAHLNDEGTPDLQTRSEENAHELRVLALMHLNFAGVAAGHVGKDLSQVVLEWNLDCPGKLGIPAAAAIGQSGIASFYEIRDQGRMLRVLGDIEAGFADKVIEALESNPGVETVSLGSGGGFVMEAIKAGTYIRRHGYDTVLWNGCYSACPLVFMGGNQRKIWSPYPELGFHQVALPTGDAVRFNDPIYRVIGQYLTSMDVSAELVLQTMWAAPPHDMFVIPGWDDDLCDVNVATWIQRICNSESFVEDR